MGPEIFPQIAIEGRECVGRSKSALEQQTHRVTLVPKPGLQANEHVPEFCSENENRPAVAEFLARRRPPLALDGGQVWFAPDVVFRRDPAVDIRVRSKALRIAAEQPLAQCVNGGRRVDRVSSPMQRF